MAKDIRNNLNAVKQRIDEQRATLKAELEELEAEKKAMGKGKKPSGTAYPSRANFNSPLTAEELTRKIANIETALELPYYADSEYRKFSIEFMEALTNKVAEILESNEQEIAATATAIIEAECRLKQLKTARENIFITASKLASGVGLHTVSAWILDYYPPEQLLKKYKEVCHSYD